MNSIQTTNKALIRSTHDWIEPSAVASALAQDHGEAGLIWLDGDASDLGRWLTLAADPLEQVCCRGLPGESAATNPFEALRSLSPGHWTGWLSYDAAAWLEPTNPWQSDAMATLWMGRHDPVLRFDLQKKEVWIEGVDANRHAEMERWWHGLNQQRNCTTNPYKSSKPIHTPWVRHSNRNDYAAGVERIRELIAMGDLFQANLTSCTSTTLRESISNLELFIRLRQRCPAPFAGLIIASGEARGEALLSTSPERFMEVLPNGAVQTRPIKGTRPRDPNPERDADLAAELICSEKDRAENVMIVDLLRNDLGRVCVPGSIQVPQLVNLESYAQVHHLTSVVSGQLKASLNWTDLLESSWPGGSISGAPKLRACRRLQELEPKGRGPYCGSLLNLNWDGRFDSNILIRTVLRKNNELRVHAGCGIVADSDAQSEADELDWKLLPLLEALE
tara:strand:- start:926 stop:2269 length:1344 start_codon:yes stop_codon:yes gene_type:complete